MTAEDWREWMRLINGFWAACDVLHSARYLILPSGKRLTWR